MNLGNVKSNNQSSVLRLLSDKGAMSRKDIAKEVGLTAASVTSICAELLENGIIVELGEVEEEKRAGRKKILVDLNPDYKKVLCLAIESDKTYITLADIKGNIIDKAEIATDTKAEPEKFLEKASVRAGNLLWGNNISKDTLLGIGVTLPGIVDERSGISIGEHSIWNTIVPVADMIKKTLNTNVFVENNLKAAAQYEILFGRGREEKNLFLLKWGPGVGSAMIIDGKVYNGANNMAGEIGHTALEKSDRKCICGQKGCLELYVSTHAILDDIKDKNGDSKAYKKNLNLLGDDAVKDIMDEKIDRMARSLRNFVSLIDPDRVVVLGYIFDVPDILERFKKVYRKYDENIGDDFIVRSALESRNAHVEPLSMVLNDFLNYRF